MTAFDDTYVGPLLDDDVQAALSAAIEIVDDQLLEEIASFYSRSHAGAGAFSETHLPRRYRDSYDVWIMRRMYVCFLRVVDRLADDVWVGLSLSRGGARLARRAHRGADGVGRQSSLRWSPPPGRAGAARSGEVAFDDLDIEFAFDPASDGIDDPDTDAGSRMGVAPLLPSRLVRTLRRASRPPC
ncbi:MAG: hypothetical protein R2726_10295 [Acidimicrobiales bacterium]